MLELNNQQLDKILSRFQLVSHLGDTKEKNEVIKCIKSYDAKFRDYDDSDVIVGYNAGGYFQDINSKDGAVKLFKDVSPCKTC